MATPDVKTVFEDPEFQALPLEERRKVLSSIDSDFLALAQAEQDRVLGSVSSLPTSPVATPGIRPPTAEELFAQRYTREQQRPALDKAMGAAGTGIQALAGLVKTAVEGAQGLGDIAGRRVGQFEGAEGLEKLLAHPGIRIAGDVGQSAVEGGSRVAFDLANLIRQAGGFATDRPGSVGTFAIPGAGPLLAARSRTPGQEEISEAFQRELANQAFQEARGSGLMAPEVIGETNIPVAEAIPLLPVIPGVAKLGAPIVETVAVSPIKTGLSRGVLKAPLEDAVTKAIGITAQEGSAELVPIIKGRVLEAVKKAPGTGVEGVESIAKAKNYVIDKAVKGLKSSEDQGLRMSKPQIVANAERRLREAQPTISNVDLQAAVTEATSRIPDEIKPTFGQKILVEQNDLLDAVFGATGVPARRTRGNAVITARLGVAESISNQLDDLYKVGSGLDDAPYRDWGKLKEAESGLNEQIISAQRVQAERVPGGKGLPVTKVGVGTKALRSVGRAFIPREIEAVDKGIQRIFKEGQRAPAAQPLDDAARQALFQKYTPSTAPVSPPSGTAVTPQQLQQIIQQSLTSQAAPASATTSLENAIQAKIATYPRKLRNDPAMARLAAKAELGINPSDRAVTAARSAVPEDLSIQLSAPTSGNYLSPQEFSTVDVMRKARLIDPKILEAKAGEVLKDNMEALNRIGFKRSTPTQTDIAASYEKAARILIPRSMMVDP